MKTCTLDIETNLSHNGIWCVVTKVEGEDPILHRDVSTLPSPDEYIYVAHYGMGFDFPTLARLWDWAVPLDNQVDTILLSKMYDTNVPGGHSLKNLAEVYVKTQLKTEFAKERFDEGYSEEMGAYCIQDVVVLERLYQELASRMMLWDGDAIRMEHTVRALTNEQQRNGFKLDVGRTNALYTELHSRRNTLTNLLQRSFPPIVHQRWSEKTGKRLADRVEEFNPGSRTQIARRLEGLGVRWTKKTEKGNLVVDETTLSKHKAIPEAAMCLEYLTMGKKASMVEGWLKHVGDDGRVHGSVDTLGAVTARMTHSKPNVAQADSDHDTRSCWTVEDGNRLVGVDASGLELRMLAHYMNDPDYSDLILTGDIHTYNQKAAGLETRDQAKTFIYAFLYGAGDAKIGSIIGKGGAAGKAMKERFLSNTPALAALREKVTRIASQGSVPGLDGRRIRVRHEHAALNTLLQSAGAIVMKRALVIGYETLTLTDIWHLLVAQVHDEIQSETKANTAEAVGQAYIEGIVKAGEYYDMRIPLAGEAKIGKTWAETH